MDIVARLTRMTVNPIHVKIVAYVEMVPILIHADVGQASLELDARSTSMNVVLAPAETVDFVRTE